MKLYKIESPQVKTVYSAGMPMGFAGASAVYVNLDAICAVEINEDGSASLRMLDSGSPITLSPEAAAKFLEDALGST
jgi:hypothetical protein